MVNLERAINNKCSLGEGIIVKEDISAWVDINNNNIYTYSNGLLVNSKIKSKPSIIFDINNANILCGADSGLVNININDHTESIISSIFEKHEFNDYRSNDGGYCRGQKYLSFMHRYHPDKYTGFIYKISNGNWHLIDDSIHIPNTFIEIEHGKLLISDSLKREVWLYEFDKNGNLVNKSLWKKFTDGSSPDGGCLIDDLILITLWDNSSIAVLDKTGKTLDLLELPVIRPTNCKFDSKNSRLWVTSASEGLSESDLKKFPLSGQTLVFKLCGIG